MANERVMAIVGAGHVGGRAAQALREAGWQGKIVLIGAEAHLPYERPPLSKGVLTGEHDAAKCLLQSPDVWRQAGVEHVVATVEGIDTSGREVRLHDGRAISYAALLIATGGHARRLTIPGADDDWVFTLRTLDDAVSLAPRLAPGARIVVIGGGFIGLEVASSARARGCEVIVVEGASRLLVRAVPAPIAARVQALHERNGVRIATGAVPHAIERRPDGALAVLMEHGEVLLADTVVVGVGIDPADELARAAGLEVDRGIIVDGGLETSASGVFAAGDVAVFPGPVSGQRIRQETWHNAQTQAGVAARNMLGAREVYREIPWFWSDQYDHQIQVAGEPAVGVQSVTRSLAGDADICFYIDSGDRIVGASGFGRVSSLAKEMKLARTLVDRGALVGTADLGDPGVKLKSLL
ncbi:FAD-dependent oxidoreductase [Paraburkholderia sp. Ac-20347]|uniref:NAD(P)/FAD-dependent oxidoreductase n=1 Tax=Paraburkholderia sp. Ac-20347 TaxID=2703892 RepID=UPI001981FB26|nr:FAD-dependent oxidoreductase [Paraburkholderia sp. Ac-20347]MBN3807654.1 FAD-dependent oxidoreductase [Paraburkholderia sp. Ac-20347]